MAISCSVEIDLALLDQLYSTFIVVVLGIYVSCWIKKYSNEYLPLLHGYFNKVGGDRRKRPHDPATCTVKSLIDGPLP